VARKLRTSWRRPSDGPRWNATSFFLWGRNDPIFTPAAPDDLKQALPAAELRYFDGGHFVLDEYADEFAEAIIDTFSP
jgi:pimeloyl-ACP methyl ester carboxylesterase